MYTYNLAKQEYFIISNASLFWKLGSKILFPFWEIIKSSKVSLIWRQCHLLMKCKRSLKKETKRDQNFPV